MAAFKKPMMKYTKKLSGLVVLMLLAGSALAETAEIKWQRDKAKAPKSGAGSSFSYDEISVAVPVSQWQQYGERLSVQVAATRTQFDWQGTDALNDSYYWLSVPLSYRQKRTPDTEFIVKLEPGVMGVRGGIGKSNFNVNAEVSGRFYSSGASFWQIGAMVNREFGDARAYPLLAYAWKPDAITEVKVGFPYSQIQVMWRPEFSTYARLQPAGGLWLQEVSAGAGAGDDPGAGDVGGDAGAGGDAGVDPDAGAGDAAADQMASSGSGSNKLKYQNWQFASGAEFLWRNNIWLNAEAGYLFAREISALDNSGNTVKARPANTVYWQLSILWRY